MRTDTKPLRCPACCVHLTAPYWCAGCQATIERDERGRAARAFDASGRLIYTATSNARRELLAGMAAPEIVRSHDPRTTHLPPLHELPIRANSSGFDAGAAA